MTTKAKENFEMLMNKYASERGFTWNESGDRYQSMLFHFNLYKSHFQESMGYSFFLKYVVS
jgi:hypothetical protein